jgi:P-type E1-E2 ATPase
VISVALAAAGWWTLHTGIETGVLVGLAVLVVACPCGLGIATPVALWTGLVTAARHGVIVRSAPAFERAAGIKQVLFDKTGTLTERIPRLVAVEPAANSGLSAHDVLTRAAALDAGLKHPLAAAIAAAWDAEGQRATEVHVAPGRGVRGVVGGEHLTAGSVRFAAEDLGDAVVQRYAEMKGSVVLVWSPHRLLGALRFEEAARPEAVAALHGLRQAGLRCGLVSGDARADAVVPSLIAAQDAALGLLPEEKVAHIRGARRQPGAGAVAMVGDGVNDAPALAAADIGIAVGDASDLARMTADVAIVSNDLRRVPWLITYSQRVSRVMRENLFWAFAYNAVAVIAAAAGALNPLIASVAMLASSLAVVANARRLRIG